MQQGNSRIIVIDDNPEIHKDFIKILNGDQVAKIDASIDALDKQLFGQSASSTTEVQLNYQIDTALQGQEGVECISQALKTGFRYMVAFVDVRMPPGWDGIETIKHIWQVDPDVQAVICTAYSDYSWEETIEVLGLNDNLLILKKPFDTTVVRQLASTLTKKWFSTQESRNQHAFLEDNIKKRTRDLQLIKATIESSSGGIMVVSNSDDILDHNQNFREMWEIPGEIFSVKKAGMVFQYIDHLVAESENFLEQINVLKGYDLFLMPYV
ncbi:MAG: response regulator [Gammaproteobacteria bacterium]|nr:response regulator [Gammaproteobacteria bacterium]